MAHYGNPDCNHIWRFRSNGWVEGCVPVVCVECGAFGCECDMSDPKPSKEVFFKEGYPGDANLNDKWDNPYVKQKQERAVV